MVARAAAVVRAVAWAALVARQAGPAARVDCLGAMAVAAMVVAAMVAAMVAAAREVVKAAVGMVVVLLVVLLLVDNK